MKNVYLNKFHIELPKHCISQDNLLNWIIKSHQLAELNGSASSEKMKPDLIEKLFARYAVKSAQISQRYVECEDILSDDFNNHKIYKINEAQPSGSNILDRAQFFSQRAYEVFNKFYDVSCANLSRPDHLIHTSCTGYISPSAAQLMVTHKNWGASTDITHAYHMGCYAAMPSVRIANSLVHFESESNPDFTTDIVHTEMCGLHMNPLAQTPEQMVVQTLFADGHIKYTASTHMAEPGKNLKILALLEKVVPDSEKDMSWIPAPWGMQMNLSREVPTKIKTELKNFSEQLFKKAGLDYATAVKSIFAIHPGGPKIIDSVQEVLELSESQISESRKILFTRGNMSSATLPHVWSEILSSNYPLGTRVVSFAFGPGLTLFGSVFEVC